MKTVFKNYTPIHITSELYESIKLNNPELLVENKPHINDVIISRLESELKTTLSKEEKEEVKSIIEEETSKDNFNISNIITKIKESPLFTDEEETPTPVEDTNAEIVKDQIERNGSISDGTFSKLKMSDKKRLRKQMKDQEKINNYQNKEEPSVKEPTVEEPTETNEEETGILSLKDQRNLFGNALLHAGVNIKSTYGKELLSVMNTDGLFEDLSEIKNTEGIEKAQEDYDNIVKTWFDREFEIVKKEHPELVEKFDKQKGGNPETDTYNENLIQFEKMLDFIILASGKHINDKTIPNGEPGKNYIGTDKILTRIRQLLNGVGGVHNMNYRIRDMGPTPETEKICVSALTSTSKGSEVDLLKIITSSDSKYDNIRDKVKTVTDLVVREIITGLTKDFKFGLIRTTIYNDEVLRNMYEITNVTQQAYGGTQRETLVFKSKQTGVLALILVGKEFFPRAGELIQSLKPIGRVLDQVKH